MTGDTETARRTKKREKRSFKLKSTINKNKLKKKEKETTTTLEDPMEVTYKRFGRQTRLTGSEIDA
jgi:hypothetical protein